MKVKLVGQVKSEEVNERLKGLEKKMTTNTAYLLNTWFLEDSEMWKDIREFINKAHDAHLNRENSGLVEVTFRIIKELGSVSHDLA